MDIQNMNDLNSGFFLIINCLLLDNCNKNVDIKYDFNLKKQFIKQCLNGKFVKKFNHKKRMKPWIATQTL